jgi:hypothetical protein
MSKGLAVAIFSMRLQTDRELAAHISCLGLTIIYQWLRSGFIAESRTSRLDIRRELGFVKGSFLGRHIFFRNDVVDRLFHLPIFFIYNFGQNALVFSTNKLIVALVLNEI